MSPALPLLLLAVSGLAAIVLQRWSRLALGLAAAGSVAGAATALLLAARCLLHPGTPLRETTWMHPSFGPLVLAADPLSAAFLVPIAFLVGAGAVYAAGYLERPGAAAGLFNLLGASMVAVVLARHAVLFLVSWEVMTLASFLLVTREHRDEEVRRAGRVYLIAGHVGVSALLLLFLSLERYAGTLEFPAGPLPIPAPAAIALFSLALVGFGVKAGLVPLHVWLPEAHAAAPSHVSALMSGAMVKLGVYGVLRVLGFFPSRPGFGVLLALLGTAGAVLGITLAFQQRDLKRVLAYSTIENVGLIAVGLGVGLWAGPTRPAVATLAALGALLHVWNHAAMKGLLFLSAGSILHATGTRDLERLGGLARPMPFTAACLVAGAVAIAGLPPLNGFAGEWLLYAGLGSAGVRPEPGASLVAALGVGVLALVGAFAVLAFVRLAGTALLGEPRSDAARHAHDGGWAMRLPMASLVLLCVAGGIAPARPASMLLPVAGRILAPGTLDATVISALAPLSAFSLLLLVGLIAASVALLLRTRRASRDATWGCGYLAPTARMQYTGRSFAELSERILPAALRVEASLSPPAALFPDAASFRTAQGDPLTRSVFEPFLVRAGDSFARLRWMQQGVLPVYLLYILVVLLATFAWGAARGWLRP